MAEGEPVAEWPVYLPLAALKASDDPRAWFDMQMLERLPPALRPLTRQQQEQGATLDPQAPPIRLPA